VVDTEIADKLLALNRRFYAAFAETFADSRPVSDPALVRILPYIPQCARLLDLGCGNGRLAALLDRERPGSVYVGVDAVEEVVEIARSEARALATTSASFDVLDLTAPGWPQMLPSEPFDCVLALAVLHHIPGFDRRADVLRQGRGLMKAGGLMIVSVWQCLESARMRRKIRPWSEAGLSAEELEAGDYLLDWKRGGRGLRYCHLVDETELQRLALESGLKVAETFRAGGREGKLSRFAVMQEGNGE